MGNKITEEQPLIECSKGSGYGYNVTMATLDCLYRYTVK